MYSNRTLWVEDRYALRCGGCDARFSIVRRRHHCRQCGQVFCRDCLIAPSATVARNIIADTISSLVGFQREPTMKLCHKCKRILVQRGDVGQRPRPRPFPARRTITHTPTIAGSHSANGVAGQHVASAKTMTTTADAVSLEESTRNKNSFHAGVNAGEMSFVCHGTHQASVSFCDTPPSAICQPLVKRLSTHPEDMKQQEVAYCLGDVPMHSRNGMSELLVRLFKDARKKKVSKPPQLTETMIQARVYVPYPKASFRYMEGVPEPVDCANIFSSSPLTAKNLRCLEWESSRHLIKRASRLFMRENSLVSSMNGAAIDKMEWIAGVCDVSWRVVSQTAVVLHNRVTEHFDVICIPSGTFGDTVIISGVAFVQTVASKRMKTCVNSPSILLLGGDVGTTLNPGTDLLEHLKGYEGYLDKQYQRIDLWKPSVIVVEGNMHHYLQDRILRHSEATLILHAGGTVMERLAACCNASVVQDLQYVSLEDLYNASVLGTCETFQLVHVGGKPVCMFKGLRAALFTTVLLRGGDGKQLEAAKRLLVNCTTTAYHLAIQAHCLFDLGIKYVLPLPDATVAAKVVVNEDSNNGGSPPWGEASSSHMRECEEYMQLVACSPRIEDRVEALTMNLGVSFSDEVANIDDDYDDLMLDSIIVNTVFLDSNASSAGVENAPGGVSGTSPNDGVRQSREVFPFYCEGDETLLEYLAGRAKESDSMHIILHGNKRIWVKTATDFSSLQGRRTAVAHGASQQQQSLSSSSSRPSLAQSSLSSLLSGKVRDESHILPVRGYASCKGCFDSAGGSLASSTAGLCSLHTLNLSWGAFLELLIYGSSSFFLACGHNLSQSFCISFVVSPNSGVDVTIVIMVEDLTVYNIVPPPMTMPSSGDAPERYLKGEIEELQRCVVEIRAAIHTASTAVATQQPPSTVPSSSSPPALQKGENSPFSSALHTRGASMAVDLPSLHDEQAMALLQQTENLLNKLPSLDTLEGVIIVRLDDLANLVNSFQEWYNAKVPVAERRIGGKPPFIVDTTKLEDPYWAYSLHDACVIRLNEPTSLVAVAIQATSLVTDSKPEFPRGSTSSTETHQFPKASPSEQIEDSGSPPAANEPRDVDLEETMEDMLGIGPSVSPNIQPHTPCMRSTADALDVLAGRGGTVKRTFKHAMEVLIPWDKTEQVSVTVEVMFPEQFAALRYMYTEGRVHELAPSLSRCRAFKPQGGKTKSCFFATLDDRFVMKQLKQAELKHFAEFGQNYFLHMCQMYTNIKSTTGDNTNVPFGTILGKVFGVFSVHIKRQKRCLDIPAEIRYYALMENVFYSRQVGITYDLKGSQRNRTAQEGSSVLLDQDLVATFRQGSFFYCRNEAKSLLMDQLTYDAHLLSTSSIMDYSLVAGLNHGSAQLYLGIIDYLHPYTGAKVIESKVKAGIETVLGHPGRDPTIIDPVSYRVRFAKRMNECFCGVPEKTFAVKRLMAKKKKRNSQ
ncbi:putative phosphatidylinositol (3,5) kinase [Trypanosoma grayi]|uniref:putative phosphatidylinositol (3,5) kinase n=1 Tax=Trypanosoma grayi TaxID=71804 RepID=UPI0004F42CC4|nr:putative phosphatidylinositol (3,5) kinase [Trypanosoma grayi]KEG13588.1 putative phosphatidylinositol (3,5) kinase [Trypanosoma grayi]